MTEGTQEPAASAGSVPLSVRFRLASGWRVPPDYREWAVKQIESEGWPVRHAVTQTIMLYPVVILTVLLMRLLFPRPRHWSLLMPLTVLPLMFLLIGALIGAAWPEFVRRQAIKHQARGARRDRTAA